MFQKSISSTACRCVCSMHHPASAQTCPRPADGSVAFASEAAGAVDIPMCRTCLALAVAATAVYEALVLAAQGSPLVAVG